MFYWPLRCFLSPDQTALDGLITTKKFWAVQNFIPRPTPFRYIPHVLPRLQRGCSSSSTRTASAVSRETTFWRFLAVIKPSSAVWTGLYVCSLRRWSIINLCDCRNLYVAYWNLLVLWETYKVTITVLIHRITTTLCTNVKQMFCVCWEPHKLIIYQLCNKHTYKISQWSIKLN